MISTAAAFRTARLQSPRDQAPACQGRQGDQEHDRHEVGSDPIRQPLDPGLRALSFEHQANHLLECAFPAQAFGLDDQGAVAIPGSTGHPVSRLLLDRHRLARQHRLQDARSALDHVAIDGNRLTRPDPHPITEPDLGLGDLLLLAVADHPRGRGRQVDQPLDGLRGRPPRADLEELAQGDQGQDDPGIHEEMGLVDMPEKQVDHAVKERRRGPQCDQGIHVRRSLEQPLPGPADVGSAQVNLKDRRQTEHAPADPCGLLESRQEHRAQPEQDEGNHAGDPDCEPPPPVTHLLLALAAELLGGLRTERERLRAGPCSRPWPPRRRAGRDRCGWDRQSRSPVPSPG